MIKSLGSLSAYVITSKIFLRPFSGFDGKVESDLTRLKRGVRYSNSDFNHHEAFYRALEKSRLLDAFHMKFGGISGLQLSGDLSARVAELGKQIKEYDRRIGLQRDVDEAQRLKIYKSNLENLSDAYSFMDKVKPDAEAILSGLVKKASDNIHWKNLTSVQFFVYDPETNSFIETNVNGDIP